MRRTIDPSDQWTGSVGSRLERDQSHDGRGRGRNAIQKRVSERPRSTEIGIYSGGTKRVSGMQLRARLGVQLDDLRLAGRVRR